MKIQQVLVVAVVVVGFALLAHARGAIPEAELDEDRIFYGSAESFEKPAEVDYLAVVRATPEYAEIKKDKIEPGTAKYFILMSGAGDRAIRVISESASEKGFDLVAEKGYLKSLSKPVPSENITKLVLERMASAS